MAAEFARTSFLTSDGVRLSVLQAGKGPARIAFVPGWCMPAYIWRRPMQLLARDFALTALDPRGQGESDRPSQGYDIARRADDLGQFLKHYRPDVLVGWSLGALESLEALARIGADPVRGLVIVDSSVGEAPAPPNNGFIDALRRDREGTLRSFVRALFASPHGEAELEALLAQALRLPLEASLSLFPRHLPREHWLELVTRWEQPLLYCVTPQFAEQGRNLEKRRPGTRVEVFERAGHALFADEPERFAALLRDFSLGLT